MKHLMASLAIGTCLLLPSAEVAAQGRPGQSCGTTGAFAPGNSANAVNSPFALDLLGISKSYAGGPNSPTNPSGPNYNGHANGNPASQYDVACTNVSTKGNTANRTTSGPIP